MFCILSYTTAIVNSKLPKATEREREEEEEEEEKEKEEEEEEEDDEREEQRRRSCAPGTTRSSPSERAANLDRFHADIFPARRPGSAS